jgi:anti-sigma-K factor RskA
MTCAELKELAPFYGLGVLSAAERRAVEQHLAEPIAHEGCAEAIREAVEAATLLALALPPVAPPAGRWETLEASLTVDSRPTRRLAAPPRRDIRRLLEGRGLLVGLAVLLLIVGGVRVFRWNIERRRIEAIQTRLTEQDESLRGCLGELLAMKRQLTLQQMALDLLERPNTQMVSLAVQGRESYRANVILNQAEQKAVIIAGALREQKNRDYELWIIRGQEKIAAGLLHGDENGRAVAEVDSKLLTGGVDAFAVTLEPEGGGKSPTGPIVLVGAVKKG